MHYPSVSVVIITHNEEENIRDCLDAIVAIDYPEDMYEIIVVDSSTDRTIEEVKRFPMIRLLKSPQANFSLQRNIGIKESNCEFLAFTDADCIVPRDWLKKLVDKFDRNTAALGGNAYPPINSTYIGRCIACLGFPGGGAVGLDAVVKQTKEGIAHLSTCNAIFKKNILLEVDGFDNRLMFGAEDTDISNRIRQSGYCLKYVPESFVYHKTRDNFRDFILWQHRRGLAKFYHKQPPLIKILIDPLCLPFLFVVCSLGLVFYKIGTFSFLLCLCSLWCLLLSGMLILEKRFRLLVKRRKRIGIGWLSLLLVIPLLFVLRKVAMDAGQIGGWWRRLVSE